MNNKGGIDCPALKKVLVLFDFDGTLTRRDSFIDFLLFCSGKIRFLFGFFSLIPNLIGYKTRLISNQKAKEAVFTFFFKGWTKESFIQIARKYSHQRLPDLLYPPAWKKLEWHLKQKHAVVIVSASLEEYLQPWAEGFGITVLGSRLEYVNGFITGKLDGYNCYGFEKVRRIRDLLDLESFQKIYAYGDSRGDREMLQLANHSFYRRYE